MAAASECTFLLANGLKCRGAAKHGQPFCRHHDPAAKAAPAQRPIPEHQRFSRHRRWIALHRDLPWMAPGDIPDEILQILQALLDQGPDSISDRVAGHNLRALLRRLGRVPFELPDPPQASGVPADIARSLEENDRSLAQLGSLPGIAPPRGLLPDLPQMRRDLTEMLPHPRHIQPHLPHIQPDPNCRPTNHIGPRPVAPAHDPAVPGVTSSRIQLTPSLSLTPTPQPTAPLTQ